MGTLLLWINLSAIGFMIVGFAVYNMNLHSAGTKPPLLAFIIGSISATVNAVVYTAVSRGHPLACAFAWMSSAGNILTLLHMIRRSQHSFVLKRSQQIGLFLGFACLFLLKSFMSPLPAAICAVAAGYCSMFAHWANVWRNPENDRAWPWRIWLMGFAAMIISVFLAPADPKTAPGEKIAQYVYPAGFTLSTLAMIWLISRKKKRAS